MPTSDGASPAEGRGNSWKLLVGLGAGLVALVIVWWPFGSPPKDTHPPRYPTKGTLTYNGKPPKGAVVTFWPVGNSDWRAVKPQAKVEADGSYQPNSYDMNDGAMKGDYVVTVLWTGEAGGPGPDLFRGRYADPAKPVTRVTITEGENAIPPIDLNGPVVGRASGAEG